MTTRRKKGGTPIATTGRDSRLDPAPSHWQKGALVVHVDDPEKAIGEVVGFDCYTICQFPKRKPTKHYAEMLRKPTEEEQAAYHAGKLESRVAAIVARLPQLSAEQIGQIEKIVKEREA